MIVIPWGDQYKKNDMEGCGCTWPARGVNLKKRDYLEDLGEDGRIIIKRILTFWHRSFTFKF
jgi:hypothetical protein